MRLIAALLLLAPLSARADAVADLRATLTQLAAATPAHGAFEVTSTSANSDEEKPFQGKVSVGFDISDAGLRILYPKATLLQANQEARAEAMDPDRQTPARSGMSHVRAVQLAELLDAAAMLNVELLNAQLIESKVTTYRGKATHLEVLKLSPKVSKGSSKHVKKFDATLSVWLGDDGVPIAGERLLSVKASFMLMSFQQDQKENWDYTRTGDRLVATRHEQTQKSDGFGQHSSSHVVEVVRLEP
jgi:hypothetical protein